MNESGKDDGWEELDEDDDENGDEILIPEGREMNVEEEVSFLGWLFAGSITGDIPRISKAG